MMADRKTAPRTSPEKHSEITTEFTERPPSRIALWLHRSPTMRMKEETRRRLVGGAEMREVLGPHPCAGAKTRRDIGLRKRPQRSQGARAHTQLPRAAKSPRDPAVRTGGGGRPG